MKILQASEIRSWDEYTIAHEPITSIELMERAATRAVGWLMANYPDAASFAIFCGKGNNGGDGLAIARMLMQRNYQVAVHILEFGHKGTDDFQFNLALLHLVPGADIHFIQSENNFHLFPKGQVIIDALFGSGLNRGLEGVTAKLVEHINASGRDIISIDIPGGLFADRSSIGHTTINATHTLSFQCYKPAFLMPENANAIGELHIIDIGLHPGYYNELPTRFELVTVKNIRSIYKPRKKFAHKGNFGHALLLAGSHGKMGAAVLAAQSAMRSGLGLLTCHIPACGYEIMQTTIPEAMIVTDPDQSCNTKLVDEDLTRYETIGIGPGIGTAQATKMLLRGIFDAYRSPVVLDADALNIIASQKDLLALIPPGSIITPHPKEFERLFGESANDFDRVALAQQKSTEHDIIIILKGHFSFIATPEGKARPAGTAGSGFFNSTGNAGMATAGSGDGLTGLLTGLLAQGYTGAEAAVLGVYLHGLAGDIAAARFSQEAIIAGDIIACFGAAFIEISKA